MAPQLRPEPIDARPLAPPVAGLLRSGGARVVQLPEGVKWGYGIEWQTELPLDTSEQYDVVPVRCDWTSAVPHGADDKAPLERAFPFQLRAFDWCTAIVYQGRDYEGRARRLMEAVQSFLIARELWSGAMAKSTATAAVVVASAAPSAFDFTGQATTFNINVDGTTSAINLNADYTNLAGLVAALNTQITNANPVTSPGGILTITSPTTGATSQITISSFAQGTVTTGLANASVFGDPVIDNQWLSGPGAVEVTTSALPIHKALAKLDQYVATQLKNGRGVIHMTVEMLNRAIAEQALRRDGDTWVTPFENFVAADAGYSGQKDDDGGGTERWMFATPTLEVTMAQPQVTPLNARNLIEAFDPAVNDLVVWIKRDVIVRYEAVLLHGAAQVDLS